MSLETILYSKAEYIADTAVFLFEPDNSDDHLHQLYRLLDLSEVYSLVYDTHHTTTPTTHTAPDKVPKGTVVLIPFPFTDNSDTKLRPALVLAQTSHDITLVFMTTRIHHQQSTDVLIHPQPGNGIKRTSLLRLSKIATLAKDMVAGTLGRLDHHTMNEVNEKLIKLLRLHTHS
ncbi:type II toxin-antitoxin system PemK/MazF family toxin [Chitinophaga pendula]|uniref:type II toxin-antitoxin system PemK/MazF family toxin n=1 Tax=Chitinophaga TaxID=79328 RepID=UPI000BAF6AA7|nr:MULTISPECIES: type II toxin-antitoxin system PemK/MazF family toxin [Chitinophaga]ASZ10333.1 hypothetical protein CK934_04720 [Chitinophaga sp. MD30]UCJ06705.1 type II toxin-antitoxin system PemK/MazF family toxin [Chitinophaga pendula]